MTKKLEDIKKEISPAAGYDSGCMAAVGFDRCYDELMPVIHDLMAALETIGKERTAFGTCPVIAKKALAKAKERLGQK